MINHSSFYPSLIVTRFGNERKDRTGDGREMGNLQRAIYGAVIDIVPFSPQETAENQNHVGALELLVAPRVSARVPSGMSKDSK